MKRKIKILTIIAVILLVFQALAYMGAVKKNNSVIYDQFERAGFYIGFNLPLIVALILLFNVYLLKKKQKKLQDDDAVDSIGK
jgi:membrane protein insertase Oxa1/YidC/SpoIIIJ